MPSLERVEAGFAHASEAEFARILDFYQVAWEYEAHVFPILWSLDGDVLESFAPDFFLPELDLYVEMTTLRQKLVRKKNRKLRRLRELYPDVRIKLFYARDFRALMLKYGKVALVGALSGAEGQFTPEHPRPALEPSRPALPARLTEVASGSLAAPPAATVGSPPSAAVVGPTARETAMGRRRSRRSAPPTPLPAPAAAPAQPAAVRRRRATRDDGPAR